MKLHSKILMVVAGCALIGGAVGAVFSLSAENVNMTKADSVSDKVFIAHAEGGWGSGLKGMYYDETSSSSSLGYFYYLSIKFKAGEEFKIVDNGNWYGYYANSIPGFSGGNGNNLVCDNEGTYTVVYWYFGENDKGIWDVLPEGESYKPYLDQSTMTQSVYVLCDTPVSNIDNCYTLYSFDEKNLGTWEEGGTPINTLMSETSLKYDDKYVYKIAASVFGGDYGIIFRNTTAGTQTKNIYNFKGRAYVLDLDDVPSMSTIGMSTHQETINFASCINFLEKLEANFGTYQTTFNLSICTIDKNTATNILSWYDAIFDRTALSSLSLKTYVYDEVNKNYNPSSVGYVPAADLVSKLESVAERDDGGLLANVVNQTADPISSTAVVAGVAVVGSIATAGGLIFLRKRRIF